MCKISWSLKPVSIFKGRKTTICELSPALFGIFLNQARRKMCHVCAFARLRPPPETCTSKNHSHSPICSCPTPQRMALKRKADETDLFSQLMSTMDNVPLANRRSWFGIPLGIAIRIGEEQLVERLIKAAADVLPGMRTRDGVSPLCAAADAGNIKAMDMVLGAGVDPNETSGADHDTALMLAVINHHEEAARYLLKKGVDVNVLDRHQNSALHHAARLGSPQMVGDLLRAGANLRTKNITGHTPLHEAICDQRPEIASVLVSNTDDGAATVNTTNLAGNSPLVTAVLRNHEDMVRLLLKEGAKAQAFFLYEGYKYPLLYVARKNLRITKLLVSQGAFVHTQTGEIDGFSALHWAAISGSPDVLHYLAGNGSRLERTFYELEMGGTKFHRGTALHLAVLHGKDRQECVNVLIEKGANVNAQDWDDLTPLAALCKAFSGGGVGWCVDIATALLRAGADETITNRHDERPIELLGEGVDPDGVLKGLLSRASIWRRRKLWVLLRSRRGKGVDFLRQSTFSSVTQRLVAIGEEGVFRRVMSFV